MAKKYYGVRKGLVPGIYNSWPECQANVNGFPGAIYQAFPTREGAENFVYGKELTEKEDTIPRIYSNAEAVAYIDGSYNPTKNEYAYGVVLFHNGIEERFAEKFSDSQMAIMNNVAGEIEGAKRAMKFCLDNGIKSIDIFHDYEGISKWCTKAWKANKPGTMEYRDYYNKISKDVKINFVKVKSHSGDKYNDLADLLAKQALGIEPNGCKVSQRDNGIVANGINYEDLCQIIELLKEDFFDLIVGDEVEIPYGVQIGLIINTPNKQSLKINVYKEKKKIWINGKKEDLFNRLSLYIVELLEVDEIPEFLNTVNNLNVDKDVIETEFIRYLPNSHNKIPKELNNYLHQAIYNLHINGDFYATNFLVEPVIRPLEGILKIALQNNDIPIRKGENNYDSFFVFGECSNGYTLKSEYIKSQHSKELLKYLSECYTYYHRNRHTLMHWDNPNESEDTTRILKTVQEAHTVIHDSLKIIDSYYKIN